MKRSEFIATRLCEVLLNGDWIANTNFRKQIESVTWEQATQKIGTLNSIAKLTYHINYYLVGIINVLDGGDLEIQDKYSFDDPSIDSAAEWEARKKEFLINAEKFVGHIARMEELKWDEVFVDEKYGTYQRNIEGVIEHCYYHLGQISLIKKLIETDIMN